MEVLVAAMIDLQELTPLHHQLVHSQQPVAVQVEIVVVTIAQEAAAVVDVQAEINSFTFSHNHYEYIIDCIHTSHLCHKTKTI